MPYVPPPADAGWVVEAQVSGKAYRMTVDPDAKDKIKVE